MTVLSNKTRAARAQQDKKAGRIKKSADSRDGSVSRPDVAVGLLGWGVPAHARTEAPQLLPSETLTERAAALIERDILTGVWQPDCRLGIHALSKRYNIGATPLREGLSRLVSRGLIEAIGQRGFRVASVSREDLADITAVRVMVETEALRRSMRDGQDDWEAGIIASLHRLSRFLQRDPQTTSEGTPDFDRLHKTFHRSLLEACGSERLLRLHDDLYSQAYRYRRVMMSREAAHVDFLGAHTELANVVLSRDVDAAVAALTAHLQQTLHIVYGDVGDDAPRSGRG